MIYAFNSIPTEWHDRIRNSLDGGIGRFGWSYDKTQDLNASEHNEEKTRCRFLLDLKQDDYVIYINMPSYGKCTLAKVSGSYFFQQPMDEDFNHSFLVDNMSIRVFDRNDRIVPPAISSRLKLQKRYWRIYFEEDFKHLLRLLDADETYTESTRTLDDHIEYFFNSASNEFKIITGKIQSTHPRKDLEELMCKVFKNSSRYISIESKRGRADRGADIILRSSEFPTDELQRTCLVQVKSFSGTMETTQAINDLEKAFEYYSDEVDCGLIVTTATDISQDFLKKLEEFGKKQGKPVGLLYGEELTKFILKNL